MKEQDYAAAAAAAAMEDSYEITNSGEVEEAEESGWTSYFEDFCGEMKEKEGEISLCSSASMVSDASSLPILPSAAAGGAAWNNSSLPLHHHQQQNVYSGGNYDGTKLLKKLSFKKRRGRDRQVPGQCYYDDSLEDTASSPVSSPKVYDLRKTEVNFRRTSVNDMCNSDPFGTTFRGKINGRSSYLEQEQHVIREDEMMTMMDFNSNSKNEECTELKKKGLCLVPLSMLLHYMG